LHDYHIRQVLAFRNASLRRRLEKVRGRIRETSADKQKLLARYKSTLTAAALRRADRSNGRRLFTKTCAACHTLFGEGGKVGPDITGSNRANLDYLLSNVLDPSAVLGRDYRMTVIATKRGRIVSGLIQKETDSALTIRTVNDTVVVAKKDVDVRKLSNKSIMPDRQLEQMKPAEVRDMIAYLQSPAQVPLRGPRSPIDPFTKRVPGAIEGEGMKVLAKTAGNARSQKMGIFPADKWSNNDHLWWTGGKRGAKLDLELPVTKTGKYRLEIVLTKARDYGIVQLSLDGKSLGGPIDLYNPRTVITTGVLTFAPQQLKAGRHTLSLRILGANPKAIKAYMVGLDYVRLQRIRAKE
ncbi:MAG: c-type cytochrome, partial [Planctomycetaceae bacterium]